eukprot:COSAG03_NODE_1102_length_4812_cov_91.405686_5_plen_154_part_00
MRRSHHGHGLGRGESSLKGSSVTQTHRRTHTHTHTHTPSHTHTHTHTCTHTHMHVRAQRASGHLKGSSVVVLAVAHRTTAVLRIADVSPYRSRRGGRRSAIHIRGRASRLLQQQHRLPEGGPSCAEASASRCRSQCRRSQQQRERMEGQRHHI